MHSHKSHQRRLASLFKTAPPRRILEDPILTAHMQRVMEMDIVARREMKRRMARLPLIVYAGWESSSGFRMATELRRFWYEYFVRFAKFGPTSLPSSFNVLEAFVRFDSEYFVLQLRPEREHLLRFSQYLDWYTASSFPEEPRSLRDIMSEGVAYSYDFAIDASEPTLAAANAKLLVVGVSMIRHGDEVAVLALAGENPPAVFEPATKDYTTIKGKEGIQPSEDLGEADRLLDGMPSYSRVLMASRFDLSNRLNDVRYLLRDKGHSYDIATDDYEMLRISLSDQLNPSKLRKLSDKQTETLRRYDDLFSAIAASLFLPAFFVDQAPNVVNSELLTAMGAEHKCAKVKRLRRELGDGYFRPVAVAACLVDSPDRPQPAQYKVEPPAMNFESAGYWKPLDPGQIGTSSTGVPIIGKTWVERTEVWESTSPTEFIARRSMAVIDGARREYVYVMRSQSHAADIYKIGSTARDVATRRNELTGSTSSPLPFDVLASWPVEDAAALEKEIHESLAPHRVSARREFFRLPLSEIVKVIEGVLSRHARRS